MILQDQDDIEKTFMELVKLWDSDWYERVPNSTMFDDIEDLISEFEIESNPTLKSSNHSLEEIGKKNSIYSNKVKLGQTIICDVEGCSYTCNRKDTLACHKSRKHNTKKLYPCPHCDKVYTLSDSKLKHIQRHHAHILTESL